MVQRTSDPVLDIWVARVVRKAVRRLLRTPEFTAADREDVEQELILEVLRQLPRFDPERGRRGSFLARVAASRARTLLRSRRAPCRDWRRRASLHDEVRDPDGRLTERWRTLDAEACRERRGLDGGDAEVRLDLRIDVTAAVSSLPPELRQLCTHLACGSTRGAARTSGVPRGAMRGGVSRIREHFERRGLDAHADGRSPTSGAARLLQEEGPRAALNGRTA